ncbi:MAG: hypothetical protein U1E19_01725 [Rhodoblastus sp.]
MNYLLWAIVIAIGFGLRALERRFTRRPFLGALLILGTVAGYLMTRFSPFNFATGGLYMEGVILAAASALAFSGYLAATLWFVARGRTTG